MGDAADYAFESGLTHYLAHINGECGMYGPCPECDDEERRKRCVSKLSPVQQRVMTWLLSCSHATQLYGDSRVYASGEKLCNLNTMTVLAGLGLVERFNRWCWRATDKAKAEGKGK